MINKLNAIKKNTTICLLERVKRRTFALFFMVLDLRLVKIGCRGDNQFFLFIPYLFPVLKVICM